MTVATDTNEGSDENENTSERTELQNEQANN